MSSQRFILYQCAILIALIVFSSEDCHHVTKNILTCTNPQNLNCLSYDWINVYGLECNQLHKIDFLKNEQFTSIDIVDSYLDDIEAGNLQQLRDLRSLTIPNSNIHNLEPGVFSGLSSLVSLNLTRNYIRSISEAVFNSMFMLYVLDLSENLIEFIDNKTLTGMKSLGKLYLNDNQISEMPALTKCENLVVLDISHNTIDKLDFLVNCSKIEDLNVAGNDIEYFDGDINYSLLVALDISNNKLSYITRENLRNLRKLKRLNLSQNSLFNGTDIPVGLFQKSASLETLNLSCTSIKKLSVGSFSGLEKLTILDLSFNSLTSFPKGVLHDLLSLTNLYINNNYLSSFEYDGLSILSKINLDANSWNCNELSIIIKNLDRAYVVRGTGYSTTNILGISCYEETKDFQNIPEDNSSNLSNLEKLREYARSEKYMSDTFTELRSFLNQTVSNQNDQNESKLIARLTDYAENITKKIENAITLIENRTYFENDVQIPLQTAIEQTIAGLKNAIIQKDLEQRNYSIKNCEKQYAVQNDIRQYLMDIKNIFMSSKSVSEPLLSDAMNYKNLGHDKIYVSQSSTVALYCMLVILCIILVLLLSKRLKKNKISSSNNVECNSLSALNV